MAKGVGWRGWSETLVDEASPKNPIFFVRGDIFLWVLEKPSSLRIHTTIRPLEVFLSPMGGHVEGFK